MTHLGNYSHQDICARLNYQYSDSYSNEDIYNRCYVHEKIHFAQMLSNNISWNLFVMHECLNQLIYDRYKLLYALKKTYEDLNISNIKPKIYIPLAKEESATKLLNTYYEDIPELKSNPEFNKYVNHLEKNLSELSSLRRQIDSIIKYPKKNDSQIQSYNRKLKDILKGEPTHDLFIKRLLNPDLSDIIHLNIKEKVFELKNGPDDPKGVSIPIDITMLLEGQAFCGDIAETISVFNENDSIYELNPNIFMPYKFGNVVGANIIYALPLYYCLQRVKENKEIKRLLSLMRVPASLVYIIHAALCCDEEFYPLLIRNQCRFLFFRRRNKKPFCSYKLRDEKHIKSVERSVVVIFMFLIEKIDIFLSIENNVISRDVTIGDYLDKCLMEINNNGFKNICLSLSEWESIMKKNSKKKFTKLNNIKKNRNLTSLLSKNAIAFRKKWYQQPLSKNGMTFNCGLVDSLNDLNYSPTLCIDGACHEATSDIYFHASFFRHILYKLYNGSDLKCFNNKLPLARLHNCSNGCYDRCIDGMQREVGASISINEYCNNKKYIEALKAMLMEPECIVGDESLCESQSLRFIC